MRQLFFVGILFYSISVSAFFCPYSSDMLNSLPVQTMIGLNKICAESMNDDVSQVRLAVLYDKGIEGVNPDIQQALYYYQLSADNGNAESQTRLAQIYLELDKTSEGRKQLRTYFDSLISLKSGTEGGLEEGLIHPYVLLMLANEKSENKWYYTSDVLSAPSYALELYKSFNLDESKKKQMMRQASFWKKHKLLDVARELLSAEEYNNFETTLYPKQGKSDLFKRTQLLKDFKEKLQLRKEQDRKRAKIIY